MKALKRLIGFLIKIRIKIILNRKISKISKNIELTKVSKELIQQNTCLWRAIDKSHSAKWFKVYQTISGNSGYQYISELTYYTEVEPRLNNATFAEAYSDKNFYEKLIDKVLMPATLLRCIDGILYTNDFKFFLGGSDKVSQILANEKAFVCKKSTETGGGRGVAVYNISDISDVFKKNPISHLKSKFGRDFIVQQYINQHPFFKQFNESSVNTVRIFTYRSVVTNEIIILHALLRIGKKGAVVDNQASGGISCGISIKSAELNGFAVNKYGNKVISYNNVTFKNKVVPFFDKMQSIAKDIAPKYVYHHLLGFDFAVDITGQVKLIEVNNKNNEINFYQMNNGPLFGDYSEEIINYCKVTPKTIKIDFNL